MLEALSAPALIEPMDRTVTSRRLVKRARRIAGWMLLTGWIVLPLLPAVGLGLSTLLGLGLF